MEEVNSQITPQEQPLLQPKNKKRLSITWLFIALICILIGLYLLSNQSHRKLQNAVPVSIFPTPSEALPTPYRLIRTFLVATVTPYPVFSSPSAAQNLSNSDMDLIQQGVSQMSKTQLSQLSITFAPESNTAFATGEVGPASGGPGGAVWYAAKINGKWIVVDITQVGLSCNNADQYNFPKSMMPSCIDNNGNNVTR